MERPPSETATKQYDVHAVRFGQLRKEYIRSTDTLKMQLGTLGGVHRMLELTAFEDCRAVHTLILPAKLVRRAHQCTLDRLPSGEWHYFDLLLDDQALTCEFSRLFGVQDVVEGFAAGNWLRLEFESGGLYSLVNVMCVARFIQLQGDPQYVTYAARCTGITSAASRSLTDWVSIASRSLQTTPEKPSQSHKDQRISQPIVIRGGNPFSTCSLAGSVKQRPRDGSPNSDAEDDIFMPSMRKANGALSLSSGARRMSARARSPHCTVNRLAFLKQPQYASHSKATYVSLIDEQDERPPGEMVTQRPDPPPSPTYTASIHDPPPVKNPLLLFVYPEDDERACVPVTTAEMARLEGPFYLNDRLIDFGLQFNLYTLHDDVANRLRQRVLIFSSLFYAALCDDFTNHGESGERTWRRVRKYTQDSNLFERDFLIIPICEHLHWYLTIICYPSRVFVNQSISKTIDSEQTTTRDVIQVNSSDHDEERDQQHQSTESGAKVAILDSLGPRARPHVLRRLRTWLRFEAACLLEPCSDENREEERELSLDAASVRVPLQTNVVDCGLHLIANAHHFLRDPDQFHERAVIQDASLSEWFPAEAASRHRQELLQTLRTMAEQYALAHQGHGSLSPLHHDDDDDAVELISAFSPRLS
jgi:hypothetical protein